MKNAGEKFAGVFAFNNEVSLLPSSMICLFPNRCKTLLDIGQWRAKNLWKFLKSPRRGQVRAAADFIACKTIKGVVLHDNRFAESPIGLAGVNLLRMLGVVGTDSQIAICDQYGQQAGYPALLRILAGYQLPTPATLKHLLPKWRKQAVDLSWNMCLHSAGASLSYKER